MPNKLVNTLPNDSWALIARNLVGLTFEPTVQRCVKSWVNFTNFFCSVGFLSESQKWFQIKEVSRSTQTLEKVHFFHHRLPYFLCAFILHEQQPSGSFFPLWNTQHVATCQNLPQALVKTQALVTITQHCCYVKSNTTQNVMYNTEVMPPTA